MTSSPPPGVTAELWARLPVQERAVQWAAYFCDKEKVREIGKSNRGLWVERFLAYCGLGPGYSWCAAFVSQLLMRAGFGAFKSAAVLKWRDWAIEKGKLQYGPVRGALVYYVRGSGQVQQRHIGIVVATAGMPCPTEVHASGLIPKGYVETIEGNTSSGASGSQNDGDGVYRRLRLLSSWDASIVWW